MNFRLQKILSSRTPALLISILIFVLMALPGSVLPHEEHFFIPDFDKLIHAGLFGTFVFLWSLYYASKERTLKLPYGRFFLFFLLGCLYGIGTEYMQKYLIPNRDYDFFDIVADVSGATAGYLLVLITVPRFKTGRTFFKR